MLSKINAVINFLKDSNNGKRAVIINNPKNISRATKGKTGTKIVKN